MLYRSTSSGYKIVSLLILSEFILHKLAYILLYQIYNIESGIYLYFSYTIINLLAILILTNLKSHIAIITLLLINMSYNVLIVSQYTIQTYDFYAYYYEVVGAIMVLELVYMGYLTDYVRDRITMQSNNINISNYRFSYGYRRNSRSIL